MAPTCFSAARRPQPVQGDKGPEAWKPPREAYWCAYSKKWIGIKPYWKLSVTRAEKSALGEMLGACGG